MIFTCLNSQNCIHTYTAQNCIHTYTTNTPVQHVPVFLQVRLSSALSDLLPAKHQPERNRPENHQKAHKQSPKLVFHQKHQLNRKDKMDSPTDFFFKAKKQQHTNIVTSGV